MVRQARHYKDAGYKLHSRIMEYSLRLDRLARAHVLKWKGTEPSPHIDEYKVGHLNKPPVGQPGWEQGQGSQVKFSTVGLERSG
jgi:hypothetical protein